MSLTLVEGSISHVKDTAGNEYKIPYYCINTPYNHTGEYLNDKADQVVEPTDDSSFTVKIKDQRGKVTKVKNVGTKMAISTLKELYAKGRKGSTNAQKVRLMY